MLNLTQELFASEDEDLGHGGAATGDPARHAKELFRLLAEFQAFFVPLMERRCHKPADDLASVIANATIDGKPINYFEAVSYYVIIAAAGHDTTSSSISGGIWARAARGWTWLGTSAGRRTSWWLPLASGAPASNAVPARPIPASSTLPWIPSLPLPPLPGSATVSATPTAPVWCRTCAAQTDTPLRQPRRPLPLPTSSCVRRLLQLDTSSDFSQCGAGSTRNS